MSLLFMVMLLLFLLTLMHIYHLRHAMGGTLFLPPPEEVLGEILVQSSSCEDLQDKINFRVH